LFTASRTFTYDDLNRMITGSGTFGTNQAQQNCTYAYNAVGNLTNKCGAVLAYSDANHPSAVTNHSTLNKNYTYDANGNMLTRGNQTLTWDIDNRVSSIFIAGGGTTSMDYDYSGTRVKKSAPSGITLYPFSGYEIDPNGVITKFIRVGGESIASKRGTSKYFYHDDHLGSINVVTDIVGTRVQLNEYDPWGAVSRAEGTIDPTHRFTGQQLDSETGLYYYGGRYYDAEIGRFISPDLFVQTPFGGFERRWSRTVTPMP
jgi:RHS repeat-associated protein